MPVLIPPRAILYCSLPVLASPIVLAEDRQLARPQRGGSPAKTYVNDGPTFWRLGSTNPVDNLNVTNRPDSRSRSFTRPLRAHSFGSSPGSPGGLAGYDSLPLCRAAVPSVCPCVLRPLHKRSSPTRWKLSNALVDAGHASQPHAYTPRRATARAYFRAPGPTYWGGELDQQGQHQGGGARLGVTSILSPHAPRLPRAVQVRLQPPQMLLHPSSCALPCVLCLLACVASGCCCRHLLVAAVC